MQAKKLLKRNQEWAFETNAIQQSKNTGAKEVKFET
jgi:hypothetical protein